MQFEKAIAGIVKQWNFVCHLFDVKKCLDTMLGLANETGADRIGVGGGWVGGTIPWGECCFVFMPLT